MQAMRLLRRDLAATAEPQDSSVAVVISLAVHANLTGAVDQSRIHLHGLKRILNLRPGGLAALCSHTPELGNKIRRADLELALVVGTPTIFGSQSWPLPLPLPASPYVDVFPLDDGRALRVKVALPYPLSETCVVVHSAMRDVLALCSCADSAVQLDAFQYQDLAISIFQRLVDYAPLGGLRPPHPLNDVCQLGLLAFMSTILHHTRQRQSAYTVLLSKVFWIQLDLFDNDMVSRQHNKYPSLRIWLIFIYAVSAPGYEQFCDMDSSVAQSIRTLAKTLTLGGWEDVAAHLSGYPWIAAFHNEPGKKLWESVTCGADEETEI
jgi:hypothetical protein